MRIGPYSWSHGRACGRLRDFIRLQQAASHLLVFALVAGTVALPAAAATPVSFQYAVYGVSAMDAPAVATPLRAKASRRGARGTETVLARLAGVGEIICNNVPNRRVLNIFVRPAGMPAYLIDRVQVPDSITNANANRLDRLSEFVVGASLESEVEAAFSLWTRGRPAGVFGDSDGYLRWCLVRREYGKSAERALVSWRRTGMYDTLEDDPSGYSLPMRVHWSRTGFCLVEYARPAAPEGTIPDRVSDTKYVLVHALYDGAGRLAWSGSLGDPSSACGFRSHREISLGLGVAFRLPSATT
jgi:hypothetical protein